jgi:signal transduction histidine kinase
MVVLDRVLSYGQSDAIPHWLARRVRVSNALALLGMFLTITSVPLDFHASTLLGVIDLIATAAFALCWILNARGHRTAARVSLMLAAHGVILGGVLEIGGLAELRTVFFPLVLLPFFVFGLGERGWLATFAAIPVAEYFLTAQVTPVGGVALRVNLIYAPALTFTMIIASSAVFAYIHRNAEDKLQRTQARAAQGARLAALGEMSSSIAHEIRNPLAAIHIAATQVVEHANNPAQIIELGERVQRIVMRASRIIEGLRSFSRDAGGDPFVSTPVERIIADTLELCGKRLADNGVTLTVTGASPDLEVECRSLQLSQVLMNLVSNAYDAVATATAERWVRIEARREGESIELTVSDSGPGIAGELRDRIFEPFFTTKPVDRGTGLGLSLSRGIVEAHHGTLELDTASPCTRFVIRVPQVQGAAAGA